MGYPASGYLLHPPSSPREGGFFPRSGRPADFPQRAVGLPSMPKAPGAGSTAQGLLTEGPASGRSAAGPVAQDGASCAEVLRASVPHNRLAAGVSEKGGPDHAAAGCSTGRSSLGMR